MAFNVGQCFQPVHTRNAEIGGPFRKKCISFSAGLEEEVADGGEDDDDDEEFADEGGAALGGFVRGDPCADHAAERQRDGGVPADESVGEEDEEGGHGEAQREEDLDGVALDEIEAFAEHERGEQEDADADLDVAAVEADEEEGDNARRAGEFFLCTAFEPALRFEKQQAEDEQHAGADGAAEDDVADASGDKGPEYGADDGGNDDPEVAAQFELALFFKARDADRGLQQNGDAFGAVGDVERNAHEVHDGQRNDRSAAGQRIDEAGRNAAEE